MASFLLQEDHIAVMSNKVGTTTFKKGYKLHELKRRELRNAVLNPLRKTHLHLLVRDPYKRLESIFLSKTKKDVEAGSWNQDCQSLIFKQYHGDLNAEEFFLQLTFKEFISAYLPFIYMVDFHFLPQSEYIKLNLLIAKVSLNKLSWLNIGINKIKIDDEKQFRLFCDTFNLDSKLSLNSTSERTEDLVWDHEMRKVVNALYINDFREFGYEAVIS